MWFLVHITFASAAMDHIVDEPPPGRTAAEWVPVFCPTCYLWLRTVQQRNHRRSPYHHRWCVIRPLLQQEERQQREQQEEQQRFAASV